MSWFLRVCRRGISDLQQFSRSQNVRFYRKISEKEISGFNYIIETEPSKFKFIHEFINKARIHEPAKLISRKKDKCQNIRLISIKILFTVTMFVSLKRRLLFLRTLKKIRIMIFLDDINILLCTVHCALVIEVAKLT